MPSYLDFSGLGYFASKIQAALNGKASKDAATQKANGLMPAADKSKMDGGVTEGITTEGNGVAYSATVPGITALTAGVSFTMIVHTVSTSKTPTLNVNSLGAKQIRRRLSNMATSQETGYADSWLSAGKPFRVTYDGTYWIVEGHSKPAAADMYGKLSMDKVDGLSGALDEKANTGHGHSYNELTDKPTIPTIPTSLPANGGNADTVDNKHASDFAAAKHGHSYNDLTDKPSIPAAYSHPSTHPASMITGLAKVATSGSYSDLSDKPTIPAAYSHPATHPASMITGLAKVATSGSYNDLNDKPTIPTIPSSLPANGGNADTVNGKHASDFATINGWVLAGENIELPWTGLKVYVAYGNGKFVATDANQFAYSEDGINWTISPTEGLPSVDSWHITYGGDKFVAIAYGTDVVAYSEDGINWKTSTMPSSANWSSVAYGGGKFVAIVSRAGKGAYSTDGINWTAFTLPSGCSYCDSVTYGNGKFVATPSGSATGAYSEDGINWTAMTMPSSGAWALLVYGNGKFVAAVSGGSVAYSVNGIDWSTATVTNAKKLYDITYGNGKIVAVGDDSDNSNAIFYSTDGINWTQVNLPFPRSSILDGYVAEAVAYGNNLFLTIGVSLVSNIRAAYSKDAITWIDQKYIITQDGVDITEKVKAAIGA